MSRSWEKELKKETLAGQSASSVHCQRYSLCSGARRRDTFQVLGKEFDISWKKLVKYNDPP